MNKIHIISGGTMAHIRPHLSLCAPAYGTTGDQLVSLCDMYIRIGLHKIPDLNNKEWEIHLHLTKMAKLPQMVASKYTFISQNLETNDDVSELIDSIIKDPETKIIFMPVALCDFEAKAVDGSTDIGKQYSRLRTSDFKEGNGSLFIRLNPATKLIGKIRKERKDIFLVGFKTTSGDSEDVMFNRGMSLLKESSCNLVLVNDTKTRTNMILTPEMARYSVTTNRNKALNDLVKMVEARNGLTFNKTKVVDHQLLDWKSKSIGNTFRTVVEYAVKNGAYKPFDGVTVGHFGFRYKDGIYSSCRKKNYTNPNHLNMVYVEFDSDSNPTAFGAKPSAGVRSQHEILNKFKDYDCIIHFHCPLKATSIIRDLSFQEDFECGSLECGINTMNGMISYGPNIMAVMLDKHGPNILFKEGCDPKEIIGFVNDNFDLSRSTSE